MPKTATEEPAEEHDAEETRSPDEVHRLISEFTELDKLRVQRAAMYFSKRCRLEWRDLENEAMVRTLDGRRKCPKNVAVTTFLGNVIRSIASETDPKDWSVPLSDDLEALQASAGGTTDLMNAPDPASSTMDAQKILEEVISTFDGDEKSLMIFEGMIDGIEGQELRELLGLSQKEFDSKRRSVRRRLNEYAERNPHVG